MLEVSNKGGKRVGGGRKSGVTNLEQANKNRKGKSVQELYPSIWKEELEPRKRTFAAFFARGLTMTKVCQESGVDRTTGYRWVKEPWFKPAVEEERGKLLGNPIAVFGDMLPKAIETYYKAMAEKDMRTASQVATAIFDRLFGKPPVYHQVDSNKSITVKLVGVDDNDSVDGEFIVLESGHE
jgi:hypothetical protein